MSSRTARSCRRFGNSWRASLGMVSESTLARPLMFRFDRPRPRYATVRSRRPHLATDSRGSCAAGLETDTLNRLQVVAVELMGSKTRRGHMDASQPIVRADQVGSQQRPPEL